VEVATHHSFRCTTAQRSTTRHRRLKHNHKCMKKSLPETTYVILLPVEKSRLRSVRICPWRQTLKKRMSAEKLLFTVWKTPYGAIHFKSLKINKKMTSFQISFNRYINSYPGLNLINFRVFNAVRLLK